MTGSHKHASKSVLLPKRRRARGRDSSFEGRESNSTVNIEDSPMQRAVRPAVPGSGLASPVTLSCSSSTSRVPSAASAEDFSGAMTTDSTAPMAAAESGQPSVGPSTVSTIDVEPFVPQAVWTETASTRQEETQDASASHNLPQHHSASGTRSDVQIQSMDLASLEDDCHNECVICMTNQRTHVLVPCGHRCVCEECAARLLSSAVPLHRLCPTCRTPLTDVIKLYL